MTTLLGIVLVFAMVQAPAPNVRTIGKGPMSGIETARQVAIRTADEWTLVWRQHTARVFLGEQPTVDFSREMVLGVFLGMRTTGGYSVEIVRTVKVNDLLRVEYVENAPRRGDVTAQVLTAPFHLVALPKHDGPIQFVKVDR